MTTDPTPDHPKHLRVGSLDYTPGELDTSRLRPEVAEHHQEVAAELVDDAAKRLLDILAATMHHADFTYNVTAELVNNLVTFATDPESDWEQLLAKLDRVIEVLEDIRDARRGQNTQKPPTREEIVRFARGGYKVRIPESSRAVERALERQAAAMNDDGAHLLGDINERLRSATEGITLDQAEEIDVPTLDELRDRRS